MTKVPLPSVTLTPLALSDLFFNSKLENYNGCGQSKDESNDEFTVRENAAVIADAKEFISEFSLENQVTPELLAMDFFARV